jgi:hypothetical protein
VLPVTPVSPANTAFGYIRKQTTVRHSAHMQKRNLLSIVHGDALRNNFAYEAGNLSSEHLHFS